MKAKYIKLSLAISLSVFGISLICDIKSLSVEQTRHVKAAESETVSITPTVVPTVAPVQENIKINYKNGQYQLLEKIPKEAIKPEIDEKYEKHMKIHSFGIREEIEVTEPEEKKPAYPIIGISIVKNYVNIREKPLNDSNVLGKLYKDSAAAILNCADEWYYIESGNVKGYVKSQYVDADITDEKLINNYGKINLTVIAKGAAVREKKSVNSERIAALNKDETCSVIDIQGNWLKVNVTEGEIGYVKKQYTELNVNFKDAISIKEEKQQLKRKQIESICTATKITYRKKLSYSKNDIKLLACLVHAEAGGQTYEGKLAVANIVINRILSRKYANTINGVIYQSGQFSVVNNGSLKKLLHNYDNFTSGSYLTSIKAAKAALQGINNMGSRLYFHAYKTAIAKGYQNKKNCVKIDDQLFW
jgi:spore germination cell wall hydrolase CwlJ-like protein